MLDTKTPLGQSNKNVAWEISVFVWYFVVLEEESVWNHAVCVLQIDVRKYG